MTTAADRDAAIKALTAKNAAQDTAIADHEARLKKLEQPVVTPPPVDPTLPAGAVFVAISGSDAFGDGSQLNPWASIARAIASGAKIVLRGGKHTNSGSFNRYVSGISDVTIMGYPGEPVTIDGGADGVSIKDRHFVIGSAAGCRNWLFQDLILRRFCKEQNGIITVSGQAGSPAANWRVLRCDIEKVAPGGPSFQVVYGGAYMDNLTVEDSIIRGPYLNGLEDGAGVGTDHVPSTTNLNVLRTKFINLHKGVQTYGDAPTGVVDGCRFDGCGRNIELHNHGTFRVTNNTGTVAKEGASQNLVITPPTDLVTASGNVWA